VRGAERISVPVQVKAGYFGQDRPGVQFRVGLAREDLDGVSERGEFPAQMADVYPLAAAILLTPVRQ
jgi:hypothetical protein